MSNGESVVRKRRGRFGLWLLSSLFFLTLLPGLAVLGLTGRPLPAPQWLVEQIEARANGALAGHGRLTIEGVELIVEQGFVPKVRLRGMEIYAGTGVLLAELPELRVTLRAKPALRGQLEPRRVRLIGARVLLARDVNGEFGLIGAGGTVPTGIEVASAAEAMGAIDAVFRIPLLAGIEQVVAEQLDITLKDARSGQNWHVSDGGLILTQDAKQISLSLGFDLAGDTAAEAPASVEMSFSITKGTPAASFGARVTNVSARDLAVQSPALAWLGVLDAPISGSFRSGVSAQGNVLKLDGTLEIGKGSLSPSPGTKPVPFDSAKVYFNYDPALARLEFTELTLDGPSLKVKAAAQAWLRGMDSGLPDAMVGQIRITDLQADPEGLFANPVTFSHGALDFKLTTEPFVLQIGQLVLVEDGRRISARGKIGADEAGWRVSLDMTVDAISHDRLLALWPVGLVAKTRAWIANNVTTGELFDVTASLRLAPDQEPRLSLGYEYRGAEVRVLRTLPPVQNASGYANVQGNTYTLVLDRGQLTAPSGGVVDVAGSVLAVPDIRIIPAPAKITLVTDSTITAALSLLDQPPFEFLTKAGQPVNVASGRARATTVLSMTLTAKVDPGELDYSVAAELSDVSSDTIISGRPLRADLLELRATPAGMSISGPGTISDLPFRMTWLQKFGPDQRGQSRVEGSVELSPRFLETFGIALPKGALTGEGQGQIEISLKAGEAPRFQLISDINQLRLSVPEIGWLKPVGTTGRLVVLGALGSRPTVEAMALTAPGLKIAGNVRLGADGAFEVARLTEVNIGWFKGRVELRGRGAGQAVAVSVLSGSADMRRANFGGGGGGSGSSAPLTVALDRLQITSGIALNGFRGKFTTRGGMTGDFEGRVNGEAPVRGTIRPGDKGRSAFRITGTDAGAVMRATGMFSKGRGGSLVLALDPTGGAGSYEGRLQVADIRVRDAPVLAELLGAISVIGLLEQLGGEGILFNSVTGEFSVRPDAVTLRKGRATGASLGVTMVGHYYSANGALDMEGVVSPLYIVNSLGQVVSHRGEGLFGFTYRLTGDADAPKVRVNPLSILTPGFFRDIFRKNGGRSPTPKDNE